MAGWLRTIAIRQVVAGMSEPDPPNPERKPIPMRANKKSDERIRDDRTGKSVRVRQTGLFAAEGVIRGRPVRAAVLLLLVVVFLPVVVTQVVGVVTSSEERQFEAVSLLETTYTEVRFRNSAQDLDLAGMLFIPSGDGPFPAAVVIHGSGTSSRANRWPLTLTQHLQEQGIVVLLPDKRGSEQSEGDWRTSSFEDLATDTLAAVSYLTEQSQVPVTSVGVVGMSQGGRIAPLVANRSADVGWVVNVVGGSVTMHEALVYEEIHNLREAGVLPGVSNVLAHGTSFLVRSVADPDFWNAIGNFDPLPYWNTMAVPSLVVYGEDDTNVPAVESARRLSALENPNITVIVFPGSGHAIEDPEGQGDRLFREDALDEIVNFIHRNTLT